ncbi:hypothetical protein L7F22_012791 [Adiantum nelumboides]|nr:hypothetical protein [Adiantum nelumboides]
MPLDDVTNVPASSSRSRSPGIFLRLPQEYVSTKKTYLGTLPLANKRRAQGEKNVDLWTKGCLYPKDPSLNVHPPFTSIPSLLQYVGNGEQGLLSYCKRLNRHEIAQSKIYLCHWQLLNGSFHNLQDEMQTATSALEEAKSTIATKENVIEKLDDTFSHMKSTVMGGTSSKKRVVARMRQLKLLFTMKSLQQSKDSLQGVETLLNEIGCHRSRVNIVTETCREKTYEVAQKISMNGAKAAKDGWSESKITHYMYPFYQGDSGEFFAKIAINIQVILPCFSWSEMESSVTGKEEYYICKLDGTNFVIWKERMMDVLTNKGLLEPLFERQEGDGHTDAQWTMMDAKAKATIRLHLAESVFFTIMDHKTTKELWDSLCATWESKSASNKVFLMKKLFKLQMKEDGSITAHLNEFNSLFSQLTSKGLNLDDEMKTIFLLCSLPSSWDTFCMAISNSAPGGQLVFRDVTSSMLTKESKR